MQAHRLGCFAEKHFEMCSRFGAHDELRSFTYGSVGFPGTPSVPRNSIMTAEIGKGGACWRLAAINIPDLSDW